MKKWGILIIIGLALLVIYLIFFQKGDTAPSPNSDVDEVEQNRPNGNTSESNDTDEPEKQTDEVKIGKYKFDLYRFGEKVKFDGLDHVEQAVVGFASEFYNVKKGESEADLNQRIKPFIHPKTDNIDPFLNIDRFPSFGERELMAIYLPPEYLEENAMYTVPTKIVYTTKAGEVDELIYFAVSHEKNEGFNDVFGYVDDRAWFLNELEVKYGQPKK